MNDPVKIFGPSSGTRAKGNSNWSASTTTSTITSWSTSAIFPFIKSCLHFFSDKIEMPVFRGGRSPVFSYFRDAVRHTSIRLQITSFIAGTSDRPLLSGQGWSHHRVPQNSGRWSFPLHGTGPGRLSRIWSDHLARFRNCCNIWINELLLYWKVR